MRHRKRCESGFTLVEVMLMVFVLTLMALMFAAIYPTAQISHKKSAFTSYAVGLAQQKVEEIKAAGYANIQLTNGVETPLDILPSGTQRVRITQYADDIKQVEVTISWDGYRKVGGTIELVTLVSDRG